MTSLDTRFQSTSTGVFLAFHHLTQGVDPVAAAPPVSLANGGGKRFDAAGLPTMELERHQLMLSQDLNVLMRLAADCGPPQLRGEPRLAPLHRSERYRRRGAAAGDGRALGQVLRPARSPRRRRNSSAPFQIRSAGSKIPNER